MQFLGRLDNCCGVGVNKMIKEGAILVTNIDDIINEFPQFIEKKRKTFSKNKRIDVKEEYKDIINILENKDVTLSIEEIYCKLTKNSIQEILNLLMNMELEGIVEQEIGKGYRLI